MDWNENWNNELDEGMEQITEDAQDALATHAEPWQGDTPNDVIARAIIGCVGILIQASRQIHGKKKNRILMRIFIKQVASTMASLRAVNELAELRKGDQP